MVRRAPMAPPTATVDGCECSARAAKVRKGEDSVESGLLLFVASHIIIDLVLPQGILLGDESQHLPCIDTRVVLVLPRGLDTIIPDGFQTLQFVHAGNKLLDSDQVRRAHDRFPFTEGARTLLAEGLQGDGRREAVVPRQREKQGMRSRNRCRNVGRHGMFSVENDGDPISDDCIERALTTTTFARGRYLRPIRRYPHLCRRPLAKDE